MNWISSFLNDRVFNVHFNSEYSNPYLVLSSVPPGSCLGPYLYILFVNDVTKIFKFAKLVMCADDLSFYAVNNNENDYKAFQDDFNNLFLWCTKWGLKINYDKCKVIHFGSKKNF